MSWTFNPVHFLRHIMTFNMTLLQTDLGMALISSLMFIFGSDMVLGLLAYTAFFRYNSPKGMNMGGFKRVYGDWGAHSNSVVRLTTCFPK